MHRRAVRERKRVRVSLSPPSQVRLAGRGGVPDRLRRRLHYGLPCVLANESGLSAHRFTRLFMIMWKKRNIRSNRLMRVCTTSLYTTRGSSMFIARHLQMKIAVLFRYATLQDYWMNRAAAQLTRLPTDRYPFGHVCHCELYWSDHGRWFRCSVTQHFRGVGGVVYVFPWPPHKRASRLLNLRPNDPRNKVCSPYNVQNSFVIDLTDSFANDEARRRVVNFCMRQVNKPFDTFSFYANFLCGPCACFGLRAQDEADRYFCTMLVVAALQAGNCALIPADAWPCAVSPNALARRLAASSLRTYVAPRPVAM